MSQSGGKAVVSISQGHLDLPGVFEDPRVVLDKLKLDAQWKLQGEKMEAQLKNISFAGADAEGSAEASWQSGQSRPGSTADTSLGILDLKGVITRANGARVYRYLPLVLAEPVRHYVRDAVEKGELADVRFVVKGPVDLIPFADPSKGEFKITAKVKSGIFAYVPTLIQPAGAAPWPVLSDISTELVFNRAALEVNNVVAKVAGLQLVKGDARIANLMRGATVEVQARLKGPFSDALRVVNTSPLAAMTGNVLGNVAVSGAGDYALRLNLPVVSIDKTTVQGTVTLPGNDAQFSSATPLLSNLKGAVTFSESGFNVASAQARLLGGDVRIEGGMRRQTGSAAGGSATDAADDAVFRAQGTVTAEALRQAKDIGMASRLANNASGSAAYNAVVAFRPSMTEVMVTSNLQGMALSLPAPLNKIAETALPVRFENSLAPASDLPGQPLQDQLSLSIAGLASVQYVRDISGVQAKVLRGSVAVGLEPGESSVMPNAGVAANIKLASVNVDAWEKVLSSTVLLTPSPTPANSAFQLAQNYLPDQIALRAKDLTYSGRKLNNLVIGGTREGSLWRANLDAAELNGYLEFRQSGATSAGRVYARLSRLSLGPGNASEVENLLDEQPANIPALDIVVDELELRGKKLGRIEIDAINLQANASAQQGSGGAVREWRLRKFDVTLPEAVLRAKGNWVALNAQAPGIPRALSGGERRRTAMDFDLTLLDSGALLKRLGMNDVVRRGKGKMSGQVAWLGSPLTLDYPSMSGQFNVNIEAGQFLKADPGLAKLLGVLSLQSLPRRLALDFRDVFSEGFAFDFVRGDVTITQGLAATNNLQMKGVNAAVLMEGSADIARETQDLKVVVIPEINAGTASLITAVINPVVGLGTFLAQIFLREPLIKAATQEFHIDGSWADPRVTKVTADSKPASKPDIKPTEVVN